MIAHYCKLFPPLPALLLAVKKWAKSLGLNNPSGRGGSASFSSYALSVMTIGYLQVCCFGVRGASYLLILRHRYLEFFQVFRLASRRFPVLPETLGWTSKASTGKGSELAYPQGAIGGSSACNIGNLRLQRDLSSTSALYCWDGSGGLGLPLLLCDALISG